ncbi:MAG: penicillin-binding transpeptidase domain-containing protein [Oscillospiraceae bacterium]|nr:penicillin-binding transpeptidase domain-containing protein [Oscillospiraceae bacterium]
MSDKKRIPNSPETPNAMMLRRTLFLLIVCGIVAFLVLGTRLFKLQIIDHDFYETAAIEQQVRETTVTASRGTIYDTNMKILAMSASVDNIYISPAEIKMYDEDPTLIAQGLSEILGVDYDDILAKAAKTKSWYQTISRKVEPEVSDKVREFKNKYDLKGVKIEEDSKRYYPYSSLAAQVIGFVGMDNTGRSGVESYDNTILTGVNGRVVRAKNAAGTDMLFTSFEDYYDAENGKDVVLTIDSTIQYYIEKQLEQAVRDYDVQNGAAAIAMDVNTGAILGMASLGNFDLNNYQIIDSDAQAIIDAEQDPLEKQRLLTEAQLKQWRNKAISDTYEPGSVFKIITLSMALNEGVVSPSDTFYCGGTVDVPGRNEPIKCWKSGGHGSQTLVQALQHSCNVAFVNIGLRVGAEKFYDYAEAFGFFNASTNPEAQLSGKTGIDLGGEGVSIWWSKNYFCNPDQKSSLAVASFGQTFNITPLQLITAVSACTNGGYLMKPYVVKEVLNSDGTAASKTEPTVVRQVISEETSKTVCSMLEQVVGDKTQGTGKNAYVAGYRIGGKTGTSEKVAQDVAGGEKEYIVSFLGVAPIDNPKIAILVLLDTPSNATGIYISGGQMGAPTVGKMFADILPYMGYQPQYTEEELKTVDKTVPDLVGMTSAEALSKAQSSGLTARVIGAGEAVTAQLPAANSVVAADSQIIVYCGAAPSEEQETVPDLTGMTYSMARQNMGSYALFIKSSVPIVDPTTVVVTSQEIKAGTSVEHGTVVEVTVADKSDLGRY